MKLFSRKSLVAGATAIAVSFAGVNVATATEPPETTVNETDTDNDGQGGEGKGDDDQADDDKDKNDNPGSSFDDLSSNADGTEKTSEEIADEVKAWIGVVSAIIGVLGSLFAFFNKYIDMPGLK